MAKMERSNTPGRFSPDELRANVRESRAYWSSPQGKARQAQLDRERRSRPAASTPATAASRAYWQRRAALLEKNAPQF
jgi:hypothetical protein